MNIAIIIILGLVALIAIVVMIAISMYNSLVRLQALVQEAWSGIDVQLKRRFDLIPSLVATVKQYAGHEEKIFQEVARLRSSYMQATTIDQKIAAEAGLQGVLKTLFAVAENYPTLKANENFMRLQQELSSLEHEIQLARRYYNGAARNYNSAIATFPTSLIASFGSFTRVSYFEVTDAQQREHPGVKF